MKIEKAVRKRKNVLACLFGFSGGGKTLSALKLAKGMGDKVGLIDTENGRASFYDKRIKDGFDVINLDPPFSPERIVDAIEKFEQANYDVIIVDSISHEWSGKGGCIDIAEQQLTKYGKEMKGLSKWNIPKARHRKLMNKVFNCKTNLIFCVRAKQLYVQGKGGEVINKGVGLRQEGEFNYEMMITFYMKEGKACITKCNDELKEKLNINSFEFLTENHGKIIKDWAINAPNEKINVDFLKKSMIEVAGLGTIQLNLWWESLNTEKKKALKTFPDEITKAKKIAIDFDNRGSKTAGLEEKNNEKL